MTSYGCGYGLSEVQVVNSSLYILIYDWSCWCWFRSLWGSKDPFLCTFTSLWLFDDIRVIGMGRIIIETSSLRTTDLKETRNNIFTLLFSNWSICLEYSQWHSKKSAKQNNYWAQYKICRRNNSMVSVLKDQIKITARPWICFFILFLNHNLVVWQKRVKWKKNESKFAGYNHGMFTVASIHIKTWTAS